MLTTNELNSLKLSATNKDYYTIWSELLEVANKLSNRLDLTSTNESDPGIVLLKVLTATADKLFYNIDANTRETSFPTAAQEESVRKLCDLLGYNIKYYQSAETEATFKYSGNTVISAGLDEEKTKQLLPSSGLTIPIFTQIYNTEKDISFATTSALTLTNDTPSGTVSCIEGQVVKCEVNDGTLITAENLDSDNRFYLPESQIAENGIFIFNYKEQVDRLDSQELWDQVQNLNTVPANKKCYKFGYDSKLGRPYIQFPDDVNNLLGQGISIYFVRTSGLNGNISAGSFASFDTPNDETWNNFEYADLVSVNNASAATSGADIETIEMTYNNYKKTIGTFDTLVTCLDYMNKIYTLVNDNNKPLVSNVIVSDIRDDINNSITVCSFNDYGVCYNTKSLYTLDNNVKIPAINNFELMLYTFAPYNKLDTQADYNNSFKYSRQNNALIKSKLASVKTLAHIFKEPELDDIVCIKNYLQLNARITTINKVNSTEENIILANVKQNIYKNFNMRNVDFGEEIPFDSILACIEQADFRIKNVSLDEPILDTRFVTARGDEYSLKDSDETAKNLYLKLIAKNILAGRVSLFDYDTTFSTGLNEKNTEEKLIPPGEGDPIEMPSILPADPDSYIQSIQGNVEFDTKQAIKLNDNEVIKFRAPNYRTSVTYPAYVNYFLKLNGSEDLKNIPATFISLKTFFASNTDILERFLADAEVKGNIIQEDNITSADMFNKRKGDGAIILVKDENDNYSVTGADFVEDTTYYKLVLDSSTFVVWDRVLQKSAIYNLEGITLNGIYRALAPDLSRVAGNMIDNDLIKYTKINSWTQSSSDPLSVTYVQELHEKDTESWTKDGFGFNSAIVSINANEEYQLKPGEYLCINYTPAGDNTEDTTKEKEPVNIMYQAGDIIRPNFPLEDSGSLHRNTIKSWRKTAGFSFPLAKLDGMYQLEVNQQIEIRERAEIEFSSSKDNGRLFLYWVLADKDAALTNDYILGPGEYVYFTDINKQDLGYYGPGTKISIGSTKEEEVFTEIAKPANTEVLTNEDILDNGLSAMNWISINLDGGKYVKFTEYQFVTLTSGNTLKEISLASNANKITSNWQSCGNVKYRIDEEDYTLPTLSVDGSNWEVCSILDLNLSKDLAQKLLVGHELKIVMYNTNDDSSKTYTITPERDPVYLKSNYAVVSASGYADTRITKTYSDGSVEAVNDFKLKPFGEKPVSVVTGSDVSESIMLNNFNKLWTKFDLKTLGGSETEPSAKLSFSIPSFDDKNEFALLMIYNNEADNEAKSNDVYLQVSEDDMENVSIFSENGSWWPGRSDTENYRLHLRYGINVIKFEKAIPVQLGCTSQSPAFVILSNPDLIRYSSDNKKGFDTRLLGISDVQVNSLFNIITKCDPDSEFYYNFPLDNSTALDINLDLLGTGAQETLASPRTWYDHNNVVNKFVISEIDADTLTSGIKIARSSKIL